MNHMHLLMCMTVEGVSLSYKERQFLCVIECHSKMGFPTLPLQLFLDRKEGEMTTVSHLGVIGDDGSFVMG